MNTKFENKDKGFTLVELLIVIVILGILATVTVFAVRGITDKAEENTCANDLATIETAIESYFAIENTYPAALSNLTPTYLKEAADTTKFTYTLASGAYTLVGAGTCAAAS